MHGQLFTLLAVAGALIAAAMIVIGAAAAAPLTLSSVAGDEGD